MRQTSLSLQPSFHATTTTSHPSVVDVINHARVGAVRLSIVLTDDVKLKLAKGKKNMKVKAAEPVIKDKVAEVVDRKEAK